VRPDLRLITKTEQQTTRTGIEGTGLLGRIPAAKAA
jgi:hypothetical protein